MSHSKVKIWIHGILGVKNRENLITPDIEKQVHELIKTQLINSNCLIKEINGNTNHVHILFLLSPQKTISEIFKQIKGSVSHEINSKNLTKNKFSWQVGYGAFSVSESKINETAKYIQNQKIHHTKITFKEEYEKFINLYHLE